MSIFKQVLLGQSAQNGLGVRKISQAWLMRELYTELLVRNREEKKSLERTRSRLRIILKSI
jgi:hypothetical protein